MKIRWSVALIFMENFNENPPHIFNKNKKFWVILIIGGFITACILFSIFPYSDSGEPCLEDKCESFLVKYDSNGNKLWEITWDFFSFQERYDIAVDKDNNSYIVGYDYVYGKGSYEGYIIKFDSSGDFLWKTDWGITYHHTIYYNGLTLDNQSNIYIVGTSSRNSNGDNDAFIGKYNSSGSLIWNKTWGGTAGDYGNDITIDKNKNVYIIGNTYSFGKGSSDIYIAKFDTNGTYLWNSTIGGTDYDSGKGITIDKENNIYFISSTHSFGAGGTDTLIFKYNSTGTQLWNTTWGDVNYDTPYGIVIDNESNFYITGATSFDKDETLNEIFILKYNSSGNLVWSQIWGKPHPYTDFGYSIVFDGVNNLYITGMTHDVYGGSEYIILKYDSNGNKIWTVISDNNGVNIAYGITTDLTNNIYIVGYKEYRSDENC